MCFLYYFWILIISPFISFVVSSASSPFSSFLYGFSFASICFCFVLIILLLPLIINNHVNICFWLILSLTNIFLRGFISFLFLFLCLWFYLLPFNVRVVVALRPLSLCLFTLCIVVCVRVCVCSISFVFVYLVCSITSLLVNLVLFTFWSVCFVFVTICNREGRVEMEWGKSACSATMVNNFASCFFF